MAKKETAFTKQLKNLRERRGFTQQQVVDKIGPTIGTAQVYSNYENGQREPSFEVLCELANLFNVTTDFLLDRTDDETPQSKEFSEVTGLNQHVVGLLSNIGETSRFINAIFDSNELQNIYHEAYLIQNMIERINNHKPFANCDTGKLFLPDDTESVRVSTEDFFAYHAYKFGIHVASAIEHWAISEYGGDTNYQKRNNSELPY